VGGTDFEAAEAGLHLGHLIRGAAEYDHRVPPVVSAAIVSAAALLHIREGCVQIFDRLLIPVQHHGAPLHQQHLQTHV
jgi:hypothetical protein